MELPYFLGGMEPLFMLGNGGMMQWPGKVRSQRVCLSMAGFLSREREANELFTAWR